MPESSAARKAIQSETSPLAEKLAGFPFFKNMPEDATLAFAKMAKIRTLADGELLLKQGDANERLFFLLAGALTIEVDGESVSVLTGPGEVVGEMSLISRAPTTASVRAQGKTDVLETSDDSFASLPEIEQARFRRLLDQAYASSLAERLTKTNEKAKRFEVANRELGAAQDRLKKINENLEIEIARRSRELVQKVQSLIETHLRPSQLSLAKMAQSEFPVGANDELRSELHGTLASIGETIDFLKPVADLGSRPANERARQVLLVDADKKQQNIARLALGGTGIGLTVVSTLEEGLAAADEGRFDLVLCDSNLSEAAQAIALSKPETPLVLLLGLDRSRYLEALERFPERAIFVSRDSEDRSFTIKNISTTVGKILNQDLFGLEKYLAWGSSVISRSIVDSRKRAELIDEMAAHFKSLGVRSTYLERIRTAAEELLMNAIYDAPCDQNGKPTHNHLPRTQAVTLRPEQAAVLRYGTDGILVGLSVEDPFGALSRQTICKYLRSDLGHESSSDSGARPSADVLPSAEATENAKGGAGRGLKLLVESSDLTVFNIVSRKKTEAISLFNLEATAGASTPAFHLFHLE